ncbi:MAG: DUF3467 domain-containing protein [Candidatus Magasanikbacteria bacterium]
MPDKPQQPREHPHGHPEEEIEITADEEVLEGTYANMAQVSHTKEEFVIDFASVFPPRGTLNSRVIVSPGHMKRIIKAMKENVERYEEQFGEIEESDEPDREFGFPVE